MLNKRYDYLIRHISCDRLADADSDSPLSTCNFLQARMWVTMAVATSAL